MIKMCMFICGYTNSVHLSSHARQWHTKIQFESNKYHYNFVVNIRAKEEEEEAEKWPQPSKLNNVIL